MEAPKGNNLESNQLHIIGAPILAAAKQYIEATSLPKEALTSVISMVKSHYGLENLISYQQGLPWQRRANMVGVAPNYIISELRLKEIDDFVSMNRFPYNTLYIAKDGNISVKANGWRMKAHADSRCFKGWECEKTEMVKMEGGNIMFRKQVTAVFWTGERFIAEGAADMSEMQSRRQKTEAPPSFAFMIAETRAKIRAWRDAIGLPCEIAEDVVIGEQLREIGEPIVDNIQLAIKEPPVKLSPPTRIGAPEFLRTCKDELKLSIPDIMSKLGIKNLGDIKSYEEALKSLRINNKVATK